MSDQTIKNIKRVARVGLGIGVCLAFLALLAAKPSRVPYTQAQNQAAYSVPVIATQLHSRFGGNLVTLSCANARLKSPHSLDGVRCTLRNNTNKHIAALTVAVVVTLNTGGNKSTSSSYWTEEALVHPDFQDEQPNNLIPPSGETSVEPLPEKYDSDWIEKVELSIDYVEFSDHSSLGPNERGSQIIGEIRSGAAKYKEWISARYRQSGHSLPLVIPALDRQQPLPSDLHIKTGNEQQGALIYRNHARRLYERKGAPALVKLLVTEPRS